MAGELSSADSAAARTNLAELLHGQLRVAGFHLVSWKGDGGVYHADPSHGRGNLDFTIDAASAVAQTFSTWRSEKEDRAQLRMRISAHWAPDVYIHKQPGYWSSDHLNLFLKYEREIGLSGTFAVTLPLLRHFSSEAQSRFLFSKARPLGLRPGEDLVERVFYMPLEGEARLNRSGGGGLFEWLSSIGAKVFDAADSSLGPRSCVRGSIGEASLLFAAPLPTSPITVDLVPASASPQLKLEPAQEVRWAELSAREVEECRDQLREDGKKVSPVSIIRPLSDVPMATLEWRTELWSKARGFHKLLTEDSGLWAKHSQQVLAMQEQPLAFPGIACLHFIVRTADNQDPAVLLCQRQFKGPNGMYHPGRWSMSFEEQLRPGESINEAIRRGLNEELLGTDGSVGASARLLAAMIEKSILNLSFIVLVDVPHKLSALIEYWQRAIDKDEHRQLATLVLDRETLELMTASGELTPSLRGRMRPGHPEVFHETDQWRLHPTSAARAAVALWAQEMAVVHVV